MKKRLAIILSLVMLLSLAACGSSFDTSAGAVTQEADADGYYYSEKMAEAGEIDMVADTTASAEDRGASSAYNRADVKLIRRAWLEVEALDFDTAVSSLESLVDSMDGYIESSSLYQGSYGSSYRSASYTVRIPSEQYDTFLARISDSADCHLTSKEETTEDVGTEYFDAETRLETLRTKMERLQKLLKEAEKMEDIISLEDAISETEYEIDQYTSTLNRYDSLIGYSTFEITIQQVSVPSDTDSLSFGQRMKNAFLSGCQAFRDGAQSAALWMAENVFGLLLMLAIVILAWRLLRRWHRRINGNAASSKADKKHRRHGKKTETPEDGALMVSEQPDSPSENENQ